MELRNNNGPTDPRQRASMARAAQQGAEQVAENIGKTRTNRESQVREALERVSRARAAHAMRVAEVREQSAAQRAHIADTVDLSETARRFVGGTEEAARAEQARSELVEALKQAHTNGALVTDERVELAADRLLGGE